MNVSNRKEFQSADSYIELFDFIWNLYIGGGGGELVISVDEGLKLAVHGADRSGLYVLNIWGAFRKIAKNRLVTSLHLPSHPHGTARLDWTDFCEISFLSIFRNFGEKIQVSLKSHNIGYFTWRPIYILDHWILCSWVRASWINVNNCPTRCDYIQFIIFL